MLSVRPAMKKSQFTTLTPIMIHSPKIDGHLPHFDLDDFVLAYAISVHKFQGSEYPVVIIPVTTQHYLLLQRNLIYTGITRARKMVVLIGTKKALTIAIKNNKPQMRFTYLAKRLVTQQES